MATTRERRMARADRLDDWSTTHDAKAAGAERTFRQIADMIPVGQPVLVGHHSERRHRRDIGRQDAALGAMVTERRTAESQRSRAANIRAATDASIFDDDDNAVEALQARIDGLEAQRTAIVEFNKAARKAKGDTALIAAALAQLPADLQRSYLSAVQHAAYSIRNGAFPAYHLSNLSGSISKQRKRLEQLQRQATLEPGTVTRRCTNKYAGDCRVCDQKVDAGAGIAEKLHGEGWTVRHHDCTDRESR